MMKNTPSGLMDQPYVMYGDAKVGHVKIDGPPRTPRLELSIQRVHGLRERVLRAGNELSHVTGQLIGHHPVPVADRNHVHEPNGLLETLDYNLDLLESDLADLQAVIDRLREGV